MMGDPGHPNPVPEPGKDMPPAGPDTPIPNIDPTPAPVQEPANDPPVESPDPDGTEPAPKRL